MSTDTRQITVSGVRVSIVRKRIKNLHLGVYPPHGRVRVAAPLAVSDDAVRLAVIGKLGWIRRQRARFDAQPRQSAREMVSGESHYFLGRRYRLRIVHANPPFRAVRRAASIELHVRPESGAAQREQVLQRWYRQELKRLIPPLLEKWQGILGVQAQSWGVKRMKTKWGTCNAQARRIWVNLELAKKPAQCVEYVVAHELTHLIERHHNQRFAALLDQYMPQWRAHRQELNSAPLAHERWSY